MYWRTVNVYYRHIDATLIGAAGIIEEKDEIAIPAYACGGKDRPKMARRWEAGM